MSLLYLLLLCFAGTNAGSLKDALSDVVSDIGNLDTKGLSLHGSLDLSPKLTVSPPDIGLSASLSSGHEWLNAVRSHIKNKVANLHAALNEIENAHSNLNTAAVPFTVTSNISPVLVPVQHQEVSPVTVSVEHEAAPVKVVEHHDITPLQVTVDHEPAPVKVVEEHNLVPTPVQVQVETEPKEDNVLVSKSGGENNLGLASNLKLHLPHLSIGGDINFNGKGVLDDIANFNKDLKAKLNKLNPLHGLEGLVSDSENKLNKLKALVNLHNLNLGTNEGLVNICQLNPALCSDEHSLGLLLKPKQTSINLDLNSGLASLLESLKGKVLSRDGDGKEVVSINVPASRQVVNYQPVPVAQAVPAPQPVAVSQPISVQQPVAVSQPVPVAQPVAVTQEVPVSQYSVGIPVSVRVPELHSVPVRQPAEVSQISQYSVGVPVSQYNVGFPVSVRIPELHSVPVSQDGNVGIPVNLAGSLQGSLAGLSGGLEASLSNGEQHNGVLISSGSPVYTYNGGLPREEVRVDGEYSRRSGSVRRPSVYGAGRRMQGAPIPMAGVNYGRRGYE